MVSLLVLCRLLTFLGFCLTAIQLMAQTDTTLVDSRGDTLLLRKTASAWNVGIAGGAAIGINTGALSLIADINKETVRAGFTGQNLGDARAWMLGAELAWLPEQGGMRYGGRIGFVQQAGFFSHTTSGGDSLLQSTADARIIATEFFAETALSALPRCAIFGGVGALWSLEAKAKTTYSRAPRFDIVVSAYPEVVPLQTPAISLNAGIRYSLHERDLGSAKIYTTPFVEGVWLPLLSGVNASSWGAVMLRVGLSVRMEPIRIDTLSAQPRIRWLPIAQLPETPLASIISEEQAVTGRIATARENNDAVLEERVVVYRPNDKELLHGVPAGAVEILRAAVPLLRSRARCRLVLTIPTSSGNASSAQAETALRLLVDYLLRRGVEEASIEAGIGESRFLSGEALQLRIRVARDVR